MSFRPAWRYAVPAACVLAVVVHSGAWAGVAVTQGHFDDRFAYCACVGTIDAPDARYTGPAMPAAVAHGLRAALVLPADAPM
jgi:hypothetical protein